ncbi:hypothetical protein KA005_30365, partial [bacterium]|nr:hypothetical protein [bacterium]
PAGAGTGPAKHVAGQARPKGLRVVFAGGWNPAAKLRGAVPQDGFDLIAGPQNKPIVFIHNEIIHCFVFIVNEILPKSC